MVLRLSLGRLAREVQRCLFDALIQQAESLCRISRSVIVIELLHTAARYGVLSRMLHFEYSRRRKITLIFLDLVRWYVVQKALCCDSGSGGGDEGTKWTRLVLYTSGAGSRVL